MSLDIWLTTEAEKSIIDKNITHNLCPMWKKAGVYDALYSSEGKTAKEVLPILEEGLNFMIAEPDRFRILNSRNSWGTYKQALPWLEELIAEFKKYPDGKIGISI